ncbi:MarR family transcriptional regulator [Streptomyces sp. E11-3]
MRQSPDLLSLLTRAERLSARRLQSVLETADCSLEAWRVMSVLSDGEGHAMAAVADAAFLPPPSLTKLVDQLVDQNVVHRRVDPLDRRRILAYLTPRGMARWRRLNAEISAAWAELASSDDALLSELLARFIATVEEARPTA